MGSPQRTVHSVQCLRAQAAQGPRPVRQLRIELWYRFTMDRDTALAIVRRHEAEFRQLGIVSLSLFGSTARGEADLNSDVDVVVRLDRIHGGFATFGRLDQIRVRLAELLGTRVDVVPEPAEPDGIKSAIDKDRCRAF
jgi:predicted nucleotidyltransferase